MKFNPKLPDDSVNIPKESLLDDLLVMLGGVIAIFVFVYFAFGLAVDMIVPNLPISIENKISQAVVGDIFNELCSSEDYNKDKTVKRILSELDEVAEEHEYEWKICVQDNPKINAFAMVGGIIVVYSGLFDETKNDIELAYVIGHEMGHVIKRHHLRKMGRSLGLLILSMMLLSQDSTITETISNSLTGMELYYSRDMEKEADIFGIDLVNKRYENAEKALEFVQKLERKNKQGKLSYYFSTHPNPADRYKYMKAYLAKQE